MRTGNRYLLLGVTLRDIHVETSYVMDVKINSPLARAPPVATTLAIVWYASCSLLTVWHAHVVNGFVHFVVLA